MDWLYLFFVFTGSFFLFTATLGLIWMPDVFTRLHATTKCDTVAAGCFFTAVALRANNWFVIAKLALIMVFILLISPTVAHLVAWSARLEMEQGTDRAAV